MSDWSVRNTNESALRLTDALLRATGGTVATFWMPPAAADTSDAGQLGLHAPDLQELAIAPVAFRRLRPMMQENEAAKYELLVSGSAVLAQVSLLQLNSADALFAEVDAVSVCGLKLLIEEWACTTSLGLPQMYRLLLRAAEEESLTTLI